MTMETPNKDGRKLPMFTPKNPDGSQRVIKQIMVIDPKKLQVAGLDLKMAEALRKAKAPTASSSPAVRSKDDKLALAKSILNKKLKRAEAEKKLHKPELKNDDLQSLMPPPTMPISPATHRPHTVLLNFMNPDHDRACVEVNILNSSEETQKKIDPAQIPKASIKKSKEEIPKTIQSKIISRELRFEIKKAKPQPRVKEEPSIPENILLKVIESKVDSPREKYVPPLIPTKDVLVKVMDSNAENLKETMASQSISEKWVNKVTKNRAESPRITYASPLIPAKDVLVKNTDGKVESLKVRLVSPAISEIKAIESKAVSPKETYAPEEISEKGLMKVVESKGVQIKVPESQVNSPAITFDSPAIPEKVLNKVVGSKMDSPRPKHVFPLIPKDALIKVTESKGESQTPMFDSPAIAKGVVESNAESPGEIYTPPSVRQKHLPKVIESKVLSPDEKIDLNTLRVKSSTEVIAGTVSLAISKPVGQKKAVLNVMELKPTKDRECPEIRVEAGLQKLTESLTEIKNASSPQVVEESAVDFVNSLFQSQLKQENTAKAVPKKETKVVEEDATSFLMSLFETGVLGSSQQVSESSLMSVTETSSKSVALPVKSEKLPGTGSLAQRVNDAPVLSLKSEKTPGRGQIGNITTDSTLKPPQVGEVMKTSKGKETLPAISVIREPENDSASSVMQVETSYQKRMRESQGLVQKEHTSDVGDGAVSLPKSEKILGKERLRKKVHINVIEDIILTPPTSLQKQMKLFKCKEIQPTAGEIAKPVNDPFPSVMQVESSDQKRISGSESLVRDVSVQSSGVFSSQKTFNEKSSNENASNLPSAESAVNEEPSSQKCTDLLEEQPAEESKTVASKEQLPVQNPKAVSSIITMESSFPSKEENKQHVCNISSDQSSTDEKESLSHNKQEYALPSSTEEKYSQVTKKAEENLTKLPQLNPTNKNPTDESKVEEVPSPSPPTANTRRKGKKSVPVLIAKLKRNRKPPPSQEKSAEQAKKVPSETNEIIETQETIESLQVPSESLEQDESVAQIKTQVEVAETLEKTAMVSPQRKRRDTTRSNQSVDCGKDENIEKNSVEQFFQSSMSQVGDDKLAETERSSSQIQIDDKTKEIAENPVSPRTFYDPRDIVKRAEVAIVSPDSVRSPSPARISEKIEISGESVSASISCHPQDMALNAESERVTRSTRSSENIEIQRSSDPEVVSSCSDSQSLTKPDEIITSGSLISMEICVPTLSDPQDLIKPASSENSESSISRERSASISSDPQGMTKPAEVASSPEPKKRGRKSLVAKGTQKLESISKSLDVSHVTADGIMTTQIEQPYKEHQQASKEEKPERISIIQELVTPEKKTRRRVALKSPEKPENDGEADKAFGTSKSPEKGEKTESLVKDLDTSFTKFKDSSEKPQEEPEQSSIHDHEKETKLSPQSRQMKEVEQDSNEIVETPCSSRDKNQATPKSTRQSRNKSKVSSKTFENQDQDTELMNTADHPAQESKKMKKVESEDPPQINSKDSLSKPSQENLMDTSVREGTEKMPAQDQTDLNTIVVEQTTPSTSRTRRSTKGKKTDEPEKIIPTTPTQTKKCLRGKKTASQEPVNIANVPDPSSVVSECSNLLNKNIAGSNPLTKDIATVSDSTPIRPEDSNPFNTNIVTVSGSSPIRSASSNQAITESEHSKEDVRSPVGKTPRNRKKTAKFDEYCKNLTDHSDIKSQSTETSFKGGPEAVEKPLESSPQTDTPTTTTQTKRKSRLIKGKINLVQRKTKAAKGSVSSAPQSDPTKSVELEKVSEILESGKPAENIQENMNWTRKKTSSIKGSDVPNDSESSALKKLQDLLENRRPTEDIIESDDDSPSVFDESIGFDNAGDSSMMMISNETGTGEPVQLITGGRNEFLLEENTQSQGEIEDHFRNVKQEKNDEEKAKTIIEIAFLGFNEKEIEEGQQSTSLRLSQSDEAAPAQLVSPPECTSKKKNFPRIKKTPLNAGKKLKEQQQSWKRNSTDSLKNWLTVPGNSSETEPVNIQVPQETNEINSSVPLKKRREREQNPNESTQQNPIESPQLGTDMMSLPEYIYKSIKIEEVQEHPPQLDLVAIQRKIMENAQKNQQAIEEYSIQLEETKPTKLKTPVKDTKTPGKAQNKRKTASVSKDTSITEDNFEIQGTPQSSKPTRKPRKPKADKTPTASEGDAVKPPTKRKPQKRKNPTVGETTTEAEPPFKMAYLDTDIVPVFTPPAARRRGRPSKTDGPLPAPPPIVSFSHLERKYKNDTEFNPRLLLIRKKEELKTDEPLIDPDKQTAPKNRDDVQCALCMGYSSRKKWIHHISAHYGIGWVVGTQPPLNITSRASVLNYMVEFFKVSKVKGLNCRLCQGQRRSALGLLLHLEQCCLTEEELRESRIECQHCKNNYSRTTIALHLRTCAVFLRNKAEENGEKNATEAAGTEEDVLSKTGRTKRKSVIKAENKFKSLDDSQFIPDEFIKFIPHQNIATCHSNWLQEIHTFGKAFCVQKKCPYTATSAEEMLRHSEENLCPFYIKPGFMCLKCKFHSDRIEEVRDHVIQRHKPQSVKDFEESDDEAVVGSQSSESGSSGDEEDEDNGEGGEIGAEGEGGKKPKKKKKSKKVKCKTKRFNSQKNAPTKDFKKLLPEREPNISDHVTKWFDKFVWENYSLDPLFSFAAPNQFYHHTDGVESYFPKSPVSMKFIVNGFNGFVKEIGSAKVSPNDWRYAERMKGLALPSENTLYAGGPVKCMAWAPLEPHPPSGTQYLAIVTKKGIDKFTRYLEPKQSRSLVYIQKYHIDDPLQLRGEISYAFAIDIGPIHCVEFLPSGGYAPEMNRLGLLAVGTVETEIKIYPLPLVAGKRDCDMFPFIRLEPSIVLCLELPESPNKYSEEYQSQCMSLVWSQTSGHNYIIGGYLNGFVAIWDISDDDDNLNRFVVNGQRRFVPVSFFYTMDNRIKQIVAHYDINGLRWLAVCNSTRKLLLYDLREITKPSLFYVDTTKNVCNGMDWPIVWENPSYGLGDAMPSHGCCINTISPMSLVFLNRRFDKFCCGVNDIHYNPWRNIYAAGGDNGDVHVTLLREATLDVGLRLKYDEKAISTLDIVPLDGNAISKKTSQKLPDGWRLFETDYKEKYGVVFGTTQRIKASKKPEFYGAKRIPPLNLCRLMRVNILRFNPNRNANSLLAVGYDNGFLRVLRSEWHKPL